MIFHADLELPILINGFDSPFKFLPQCLGEETLDGDVKFLGEDDREARIDVILPEMSVI